MLLFILQRGVHRADPVSQLAFYKALVVDEPASLGAVRVLRDCRRRHRRNRASTSTRRSRCRCGGRNPRCKACGHNLTYFAL
jgi:hypothetical protein